MWTNKFIYLGSVPTSQVEGQHLALKSYLKVSFKDLNFKDVREVQISHVFENTSREFKAQEISEQTNVSRQHNFSLFTNVV